MTVKEMIEKLREMPQGAEFTIQLTHRDENCVTVNETEYTDADFSLWHNRGNGHVEVSICHDLGGSGMPGCPRCEKVSAQLREIADSHGRD